MNRPHLASRGSKVVAADDPVLLAAGPVIASAPPVTTRAWRSVKTLITFLVLLVLVVGAIYVAVAATVLTPLTAGDKTVVVVRGAFADGGVPEGRYVFATAAEQPSDTMSKFTQVFAGVPGGMVVLVLAAPGQQVQTVDGVVVVDGKSSQLVGDVPTGRVGSDYLAACVTGTCGTAGELLYVPVGNVIGQASDYLTVMPPSMTPVDPSTR